MVYYRQVKPVANGEQGMLGKPDIALPEQVDKGIAILKKGGLVVFPTDTVYGLGACFSNLSAVERVYRVKQRPRNMGLPLLLAEEAQISEVAEYVLPVAWLLVGRFLPGALTIVLPKSDAVPDIVTGGGKTVAIRIPAHPVPISLIKGIGSPMVGTSANVSGRPSSLTADEVYSQFGDEIDLVIDGSRCPGGKESTIVDATGEVPRVLREGAITRQELEQVCEII
jgi:L-threonylcarbamoyladenylate synthase